MGKIDEVLRAYLCQFTFINTLSALPSLGFYLRLITLYLLMPCRDMHIFPPCEEKLDPEKSSLFLQLAGALASLPFKNAIGKNIKTVPTGLLLQVRIYTLSHQAPRNAAGNQPCTYPWHLL